MLVNVDVDEDVSEGVPLPGNHSGNEVDTCLNNPQPQSSPSVGSRIYSEDCILRNTMTMSGASEPGEPWSGQSMIISLPREAMAKEFPVPQVVFLSSDGNFNVRPRIHHPGVALPPTFNPPRQRLAIPAPFNPNIPFMSFDAGAAQASSSFSSPSLRHPL